MNKKDIIAYLIGRLNLITEMDIHEIDYGRLEEITYFLLKVLQENET